MAGGIPDAVRRLIAEHIYSIEQLEVLLLLRGEPERVWKPGEVSGALYTQPDSASRWLDDLAGRGLVARAEGGYRYAAEGATAGTVGDLAECYARRRVTMISLIFADRPVRGPDPVQSFADAFRFREEDDRDDEEES